jgi:hypothetical protein
LGFWGWVLVRGGGVRGDGVRGDMERGDMEILENINYSGFTVI